MRQLCLFLSPLLAAGCFSTWELQNAEQVDACERWYFFDGDGDGWGDRSTEPEWSCEANVESQFTSRNNRDCDDATDEITGQTGSICPDNLTIGDTEYLTPSLGASEFVAVYGLSDTTWGDDAQDSCGPWGWGGSLATFSSPEEAATVSSALDAVLEPGEPYAGFIGIQADGAGWSWADDSGPIPESSFCDGFVPDVDSFDPTWTRIALVRPIGQPWCLGLPEMTGVDEDEIYGDGFAHFICKRPTPDPTGYEVWTLPEESAE